MCSVLHDQKLQCCIIDCDRLLAAQIAMIRTTEGGREGRGGEE